jgi:two-component system, OmpR family, KDP operon response regulator KdpE
MTTILLVEDQQDIQKFISDALRAQGLQVLSARTIREALREASEIQADMAILDLGLPDGDGLTLIENLRSWSQLPILVLSARSDELDKIKALDAGADDYLTKPFSIGELQARMRALLRRHAANHTN